MCLQDRSLLENPNFKEDCPTADIFRFTEMKEAQNSKDSGGVGVMSKVEEVT